LPVKRHACKAWGADADQRKESQEGSHLLEGEESCTHLNGTAEGDLAVSLAEVHVPHTQVGSLNEHREVHLCPTSNIGVHAKDADVMTMASGTNAAGI